MMRDITEPCIRRVTRVDGSLCSTRSLRLGVSHCGVDVCSYEVGAGSGFDGKLKAAVNPSADGFQVRVLAEEPTLCLPMSYFVYMLLNPQGKIYIGQSNGVRRNAGGGSDSACCSGVLSAPNRWTGKVGR